jgi:hypothetical protein
VANVAPRTGDESNAPGEFLCSAHGKSEGIGDA